MLEQSYFALRTSTANLAFTLTISQTSINTKILLLSS